MAGEVVREICSVGFLAVGGLEWVCLGWVGLAFVSLEWGVDGGWDFAAEVGVFGGEEEGDGVAWDVADVGAVIVVDGVGGWIGVGGVGGDEGVDLELAVFVGDGHIDEGAVHVLGEGVGKEVVGEGGGGVLVAPAVVVGAEDEVFGVVCFVALAVCGDEEVVVPVFGGVAIVEELEVGGVAAGDGVVVGELGPPGVLFVVFLAAVDEVVVCAGWGGWAEVEEVEVVEEGPVGVDGGGLFEAEGYIALLVELEGDGGAGVVAVCEVCGAALHGVGVVGFVGVGVVAFVVWLALDGV